MEMRYNIQIALDQQSKSHHTYIQIMALPNANLPYFCLHYGELVVISLQLLLFAMMLSQFYSRRTSLQPPRKEETSKQEEDIINSFYEERKSRSSSNIKQHNLLRKNISYFQKEQQESPPKPPQQIETKITNKVPVRINEPAVQTASIQLSRPPIPRPLPAESFIKNSKNTSQSHAIPPLPLKQLSHNASQPSSHFSSISLSKTGSQQQEFKAHLKNELHKRINIQHYLTEISEDNKENPTKPKTDPANEKSMQKIKLKYNYDATVPQRLNSDNISEQFSRISNANDSAEDRAINESRQSITTNFHQTQNNFEFSRNSLTDRIQQINHPREQSFSQSRQSIPTLGDSARRSDTSKKTEREQVGRSLLTGDQLLELHQNSHPIREEGSESQPTTLTTLKHNLKFFQPEVHAQYKRKIGDLQRELEALKSQHRREDKFIHSIQKMRRLMDGAEEDCSLKELWRWIKKLPQKK